MTQFGCWRSSAVQLTSEATQSGYERIEIELSTADGDLLLVDVRPVVKENVEESLDFLANFWILPSCTKVRCLLNKLPNAGPNMMEGCLVKSKKARGSRSTSRLSVKEIMKVVSWTAES